MLGDFAKIVGMSDMFMLNDWDFELLKLMLIL
jgi:hypothetical protein